VHLLGHSAGSIFLAAMLPRLEGVPIASLSFLAPALRVDTFMKQVAPHLRQHIGQFATFGLDERRELDDVCGLNGKNVYRKSLLYLVSRALERPAADRSEVPLVGMERFVDTEVAGTTVDKVVHDVGGSLIWSPAERPANSRSDCSTHGGFDDDSPTMTSVMLRILGSSTPSEITQFQAHAQRREPEPADPTAAPAAEVSANATIAALQHTGWQKTKSRGAAL
jgi:hypothetical protein